MEVWLPRTDRWQFVLQQALMTPTTGAFIGKATSQGHTVGKTCSITSCICWGHDTFLHPQPSRGPRQPTASRVQPRSITAIMQATPTTHVPCMPGQQAPTYKTLQSSWSCLDAAKQLLFVLPPLQLLRQLPACPASCICHTAGKAAGTTHGSL
jgi:hypothetical protein